MHGKDNHVGGCNFCNRWTDANGHINHEVVELSGGGLIVRICRDCARELLPTLQAFSR